MSSKVFVGNLPWSTDTESLVALLGEEGYAFKSAKVITDRESGRSRGFAFIEFDTPEAAADAIVNLSRYVLDGRTLRASEANERPQKAGGSERGAEEKRPGKERRSSARRGDDW